MPRSAPRTFVQTLKPRSRVISRRLRRQVPDKDTLLSQPWLRPVRPYLSDDRLWALERHSVAKGVAMGLFMGTLLPVAQFLFAVVGATLIRGHVAISAACTLVTNPLTVPPIYWAAYEIGDWLVPGPFTLDLGQVAAASWAGRAAEWLLTHGMPLMTGLFVLAVAASVLGFLAVHMLWKRR